MQDNFVDMRLIYVNMYDNHNNMQLMSTCMQDDFVSASSSFFCFRYNSKHAPPKVCACVHVCVCFLGGEGGCQLF